MVRSAPKNTYLHFQSDTLAGMPRSSPQHTYLHFLNSPYLLEDGQ